MTVDHDDSAMDRRVERRIRRRQLKSILDSLRSIADLSVSNLIESGSRIQQLSMSLDEDDEGEDGPLYFTPYTGPVKRAEIDTIASYYPDWDESPFRNALSLCGYLDQYFQNCILPDRERNPPGSAYSDYGDFNFDPLMNTSGSPRWEVQAAWNMPATKDPHMKVLMYSSSSSDMTANPQALPRRTPRHHRSDARTTEHKVASSACHRACPPISVAGMHHVRVLEAFFDGSELVVRATEFYDLKCQNHELLILLSRWWLGYASACSTRVV